MIERFDKSQGQWFVLWDTNALINFDRLQSVLYVGSDRSPLVSFTYNIIMKQ